jgi:hypothetical protein
MISRFSRRWFRFCCVSLAPFAFWLLTLLLPNTACSQGNFLPGVNYPVEGVRAGVAVGDINGDKKLDVVVANATARIGILLGNGNSKLKTETFINIITTSTPCTTYGVALGDFNGYGFLYLAVLCQNFVLGQVSQPNGSIQILLGNGDGTFRTPVVYAIDGLNPSSIFVADFNGDKKLDLAVLNQASNNITILLGNGDGTFGTAADYAMPSDTTPGSMAIGDLNGDGRADIAVAGFTSQVGVITVFLANPDGSLGTATNWITTTPAVCAQASCSPPTAVAITDVNNDGKLDLVADDNAGAGLVCLVGNGDGTFSAVIVSDAARVVQTVPATLATGDFNGDGKQDVAEALNFPTNQNLVIYHGNGDGTFQPPVFLSEGQLTSYGAGPVVSSDLNADGFTDLVLGTVPPDGTSAIIVVLNCGLRCTSTSLTSSSPNSSFNQPVTFTATVSPISSKATGTPTGLVSFQDTGTFPVTNLGTATLATGSAAFVYSGLSVGGHAITAIYQGDQNFTLSTSSPFVQGVSQASTTTAISSSPNPSSSGQSVTFTAVVSPSTSGVPTGSVVFSDNGSQSVSIALDATGSASFSISSLTTGAHSITWAYSGDGNFNPSTSATLSQIVGTSSAPLVISSNRTSATVGAGQSASFLLAITPLTGFNSSNSISFGCSGLPALSNCSFTPATLTTTGHVVTTTLSITTSGPHTGSATLRPFGSGVFAAGWLLIAGLICLPFSGKCTSLSGLIRLVCVMSLVMLFAVACGGGSGGSGSGSSTTPAGTYSIVVTATAGSGSQTQNLSLTVTQ